MLKSRIITIPKVAGCPKKKTKNLPSVENFFVKIWIKETGEGNGGVVSSGWNKQS
jgi:hypothetical protein